VRAYGPSDGPHGYFLVPIVGPLIGGVIGAVVYDLFVGDILRARGPARQDRDPQAAAVGAPGRSWRPRP
jgi:glycerol uptake facilitator protein